MEKLIAGSTIKTRGGEKEEDECEKIWCLSFHDITDQVCVDSIGELLSSHERLQNVNVLDFSCNGNIGPVGTYAIMQGVKMHGRIRKINLSATAIGDGGCKALSDFLVQDSVLRVLDIHACRVGDEGAISLSKGLCGNSTLEELDLSANDIEDEGVIALATVIEQGNTGIKRLGVRTNDFGDRGLEVLRRVYEKGVMENKGNMGDFESFCVIS